MMSILFACRYGATSELVHYYEHAVARTLSHRMLLKKNANTPSGICYNLQESIMCLVVWLAEVHGHVGSVPRPGLGGPVRTCVHIHARSQKSLVDSHALV